MSILFVASLTELFRLDVSRIIVIDQLAIQERCECELHRGETFGATPMFVELSCRFPVTLHGMLRVIVALQERCFNVDPTSI
jgi:hypothetical protein